MLKFQGEGFQTFAPAQRGYGQTRSNKTDEVDDFALDCLRDDVASFMENINSGRKVTLVIHDWGSLVGFHLARTRPDLVERIIAFNSVSLPAYIETALNNRKQRFASYYVYFFQLPIIPELVWKINDFALHKFILRRMGTRREDVEDVMTGMGARKRRNPFTEPINWYRALGRVALKHAVKHKSGHEHVKIPHNVLILWGDKDIALIKELPENERKYISGDVEGKVFNDG